MIPITVEHLGKAYRVEDRGRAEPPRTGVRAALGRVGITLPARRPPREVWALKDVSFLLGAGMVLGVIGHNGAGKTTLLKLLARVTLPTVGRAVVRGRVVSLLGLGDAFQAELSARENIFLHAALYGIPDAEVRRTFDEIIDFAGLGEFVDSPVGKYSSGMYLRLAFSVAVNMRPDVILADEVLAVGDIDFQERCLRRVEQAGKEGVAVIFVSHDMEAISRLCHRVIRLDRGKIVDAGSADEVVGRYEEGVQAGWATKDGGKDSAFAEIVTLRLTDPEGREIDAPRESRDFLLHAVCRTFEPGLELRPVLTLHSGEVMVLRSRPTEPWRAERPGVRHVSVRLPGGLLAERFYTARLALEIVKDGEVVGLCDRNGRRSFRLYGELAAGDTSADRIVWDKANRPGVVAPRLAWTTAGAPAEPHPAVVGASGVRA